MNQKRPNEGRSAIYTPFTGVLPDDKSETINAGIPLFELMCVGAPTGTQLFGFHDVDVRIRKSEKKLDFSLEYDIRWQRGVGFERNYVRYVWDKKTERSYVFIPDDPAWHNRIMIASMINSGKFVITRYINKDGVISGDAITEEMKFIADYIFDHSVTSEGEVLFRSKSISEAKSFALTQTGKGVKCQVVKSMIPEIEKLVKEFGVTWKVQPEFINGIRKTIEDHIRSTFGEPVPVVESDPKQLLEDALRSLPPQEILAMVQQSLAGNKQQQTPPQHEEAKSKPLVLENIGTTQIREIAEDLDIFVKGMQREDMIKAIKEHNKAAEEKKVSPPPLGTITEKKEFR